MLVIHRLQKESIVPFVALGMLFNYRFILLSKENGSETFYH